MLETLRIKNVALIDELEINFSKGLNILSGETGAGKSIIIDSIGFVLGERAAKEFIRNGAAAAQVDALFYISSPEALKVIGELGAEADDDNALLITRQITAEGKSTARLNGRPVTAGVLKELANSIVDIHSQHQHQSLLDANRHITLLDRFCGGSLPELKSKLSGVYKACRDAQKAMSQISQSPEDMEAKIDLYRYQVKEIESAKLRVGEEEELMEKRKLLNNSEKVVSAAHTILELLQDGEGSALDKLSDAQGLMAGIASFGEDLESMSGILESALADLDDMAREFRRFAEELPQSEDELDEVEERLDELYRLKRKYGRDIPGIVILGEKAREKLETLQNSGEEIERLDGLIKTLRKEALDLCARITSLRRAAAEKIRFEIEGVLKDLGMKDAEFAIEITQKGEFTADGSDKAEFLISANRGEAVKPLAKVASGGEMSRVMLAIKTALADFDCIETFIFDEIDTGVSGRTAQMVAEKLAQLGKNHQILCITHLPQIAAMGDQNLFIEKTTADGMTTTSVRTLDRRGVTRELARLTGGAEITDATLKAADEMKRLADNIKR